MNALEHSRDFFQTLADTQLEEQKDFVYQSLKSQTAEELLNTPTTYSDKDQLVILKSKVQAFANERNQEITKLAKEFSAFFDRKETLLATHPSFSAKQRILKTISLEYISRSDQALVEKIQGVGKHAFRKWERFLKVDSVPVEIHDFLMSRLKEWGNSFASLQAQKNKEKIEGKTSPIDRPTHESNLRFLREQLKEELLSANRREHFWVVENRYLKKGCEGFSEETLIEFQQLLSEVKNEFLETYEEFRLKRKQEKIERNQKREEATGSLLKSLTEFERVKRELRKDEEYLEFKLQKELLKQTFIEVSSFCEIKELSNHAKITNESKALIRKWARLS